MRAAAGQYAPDIKGTCGEVLKNGVQTPEAYSYRQEVCDHSKRNLLRK
jgi:hypothetical protein